MGAHADRYGALRDFLLPWSDLWAYSVLRRWDPMESLVPEAWFEMGARLDEREQYRIGQGEPHKDLPESLEEWIKASRSLVLIERALRRRALTPLRARGLVPKKQHEIEAILGYLQESLRGKSVVDVGGGAGYLARLLATELSCRVISIDPDSRLQQKARELSARRAWPPEAQGRLSFLCGAYPETAPAAADWIVGLHTCGDLAWALVDQARAGISVMSVGCCYEKLSSPALAARSSLAREHPLPWTSEALFLSNRGGVVRSEQEFLFQQRVQRYRFTLHALLCQEGLSTELLESVGTPDHERYLGSFADYARDRASLTLSTLAIEEFRETVSARVERQRFAAFLRNCLARPLELALLLDRALYAEEMPGVQIRLVELFDPGLSPRNIGLISGTRASPSNAQARWQP